MSVVIQHSLKKKRRSLPEQIKVSSAKYLAILRISMANNLAYMFEVIFRALLLVVLVFILGQLWKATYAQHKNMLPGFTVSDMIWYLAAAETLALSLPALTAGIDQEVRNGQLAYLIGRPCSYMLYKYASYLGERLVRIALNGLIAAALALIFVGPPDFGWTGMLVWPLMVLLAISIEFACYFAIGLLAFWTENTSSFSFLFSRLTLVLGGVLAPLSIFPQPLRSIAEAMPFGAMLYGPSLMLVHFSIGMFGQLVTQQVVVLIICLLIASGLYAIAARRVSINGG